ncbi:heavy metal translocating P-type ATPase, partial [Brevibacterium sp. UCMA 11754]|nr:heavy metal translocating P-type ATPase [Brevibacterium sp. UCMA 11754]
MGAHHEHENHSGHSGVGEHLSRDADSGHADREVRHMPAGREEDASHGDHTGHAGHGDHEGHGGHAGHGDHVAQFRRLFWIMLVIAIPVIAFSPMFGHLVGYAVSETGGLSELRDRNPGMMLLIALAITVAFLSSWGSSLGLLDAELDFWWELALLVVIMLAGHWLEMRSLAQTTSALDSL